MSIDKVQLKQEEVVGNDVVLNDINPKTNTRSITDSSTGTSMDITIEHIWQSINNKLSRIVNSVNGRTGVVVLNADDVGLGNVDNVPLSDIKKWVINKLKVEFNNKRIKLFGDLHEAETFISDNDESKRDSPYYSHHGFGNDKRGYIGYIYWDDVKNELNHSYMVIDTVGWTDNSVLYNETVNNKNFEGGGLGVNIWKYEDALKIYNESAGIKNNSGLMIDKSNVMPNVIFCPSLYQISNGGSAYLICDENDPKYDIAHKASINIMGQEDVTSGVTIISCRINPDIQLKYRDIIVCNFIYEPRFFNDKTTGKILDKFVSRSIYRNTAIGIVRSAPTLENPTASYGIYFYPIRPITGFGIQNKAVHIEDYDAKLNPYGAGTPDTEVSLKLASGKIESENSEKDDFVNVSGLQVFDNASMGVGYPYDGELPKLSTFTNFPSGPENVFKNEYTDRENFGGLFITPDSSLMVAPYKYFGPDATSSKVYTFDNHEYHTGDGSVQYLTENYKYSDTTRSNKVSNWHIDTLAYTDNGGLEKNSRILSDSSLLGINLMKIVHNDKSDGTMKFGNISGLRINKSFNQYFPSAPRDWLRLNAEYYGKTEAEMDEYNIDVSTNNGWLEWQHTSGGLSVNVGKFLEIEPKGYAEDKKTFYDGGKVNVRIGKGLRDAPPEGNDKVYKFGNTNGSNRIEVHLADSNVMEFDKKGAIRLNANSDMGLTWGESVRNSLCVKIGDFLTSEPKDANGRNQNYIPASTNNYGGLRFFNGYLAIRINDDDNKVSTGNHIHKGTRGLSIDDDNILGVQVDQYQNEIGFNEQGELMITDNNKINIGLQLINSEGEVEFTYKPNPKKDPSSYQVLKIGKGLILYDDETEDPYNPIPDDTEVLAIALREIDNLSVFHLSCYLSINEMEQFTDEYTQEESMFNESHQEVLRNSNFRDLAISCGLESMHMATLIAIAICKYETLDVLLNGNENTELKFGVVEANTKIETKLKSIVTEYFSKKASDNSAFVTQEKYDKYSGINKDLFGVDVEAFPQETRWGLCTITGEYDLHKFVSHCLANVYNIIPIEGTEGSSYEACKRTHLKYIATAVDAYNWMVSENWFKVGQYINTKSTKLNELKNRIEEKKEEIRNMESSDLKNELSLIRETKNRRVANSSEYYGLDSVKVQIMINNMTKAINKLSANEIIRLTAFIDDINETNVDENYKTDDESIRQALMIRVNGESKENSMNFSAILKYYQILQQVNGAIPAESCKSELENLIVYLEKISESEYRTNSTLTLCGLMRAYNTIIKNKNSEKNGYYHIEKSDILEYSIRDIFNINIKMIDLINKSSSESSAVWSYILNNANTIEWRENNSYIAPESHIDSFLCENTIYDISYKMSEIINTVPASDRDKLSNAIKEYYNCPDDVDVRGELYLQTIAPLKYAIDFINNYKDITNGLYEDIDEDKSHQENIDSNNKNYYNYIDSNNGSTQDSSINSPYCGAFTVIMPYEQDVSDGIKLVGRKKSIGTSNMKGDEIFATVDGVVEYADYQYPDDIYAEGYGKYVCVKSSNGDLYYYTHLSELNVKKGETVSKGYFIGREGSTGCSIPHCEYCVKDHKTKKFIDVSKLMGIPNEIGEYDNGLDTSNDKWTITNKEPNVSYDDSTETDVDYTGSGIPDPGERSGFSNSSLVSYTYLNHGKWNTRTEPITKVTWHCWAGSGTLEGLFQSCVTDPSREMSANYAIENGGRVGMFVEEKNRSWCSSSSWNDQRAVTIEIANKKGVNSAPWELDPAAYDKAIELTADICRRNGIRKLTYTRKKPGLNTADLAASKNDHSKADGADGSLTFHHFYDCKSCPGEWSYDINNVNKILNAVNAMLDKWNNNK